MINFFLHLSFIPNILIYPDDCEPPNILNIVNVMKPISMNTLTNELNKCANKDKEDVLECLLCTETFPVVRNGEKSPLLAHLLAQHKIVIADVDKIADFNRSVNSMAVVIFHKNLFLTPKIGFL